MLKPMPRSRMLSYEALLAPWQTMRYLFWIMYCIFLITMSIISMKRVI